MSWSTSELRVRLAPLNRFKPSSKIFYWPFQGGTSFVDLLCFCSVLCLLCFVRVCLYVLCGHLLGKGWPLGSRLWCLLWVCHFPIGILGQVWYLIVSIPDLCNLITLDNLNTRQRSYHNLPNSGFWGWLSVESQHLNPEFRKNPENFHSNNQDLYSSYLALLNTHTRLIIMINILKWQPNFLNCFKLLLFIHVPVNV